jgi:glycosyltransferase involved in cell wall biosynthesis
LRTNVTYIISNINKALAFEWIVKDLSSEKINLRFVILNPGVSELEMFLVENNIPFKRICYKGKTSIVKSIIATISFLRTTKTSVIHTHMFEANIVGLISAWFLRIPKRIYTRHHSSYHHDYFPGAVKYDKLCNYLSTDIIATTNVVKEILKKKESVSGTKIKLIHHGFKLESFTDVPEQEILNLKQKYDTQGFYPVIGVISRYTEWKGIQYIIPAFKKLLTDHPNAKLILANANGDHSSSIKEMLKDLPSINYTEIEFENNLFALYKLFDVFVHVPIDKYSEAFGQVYVESLAASIPSVFTISGIANDFIKHRYNAIVADYKNEESIYSAIKTIIQNPDLAVNLAVNGKTDVQRLFPISKMISELESLYLGFSDEK